MQEPVEITAAVAVKDRRDQMLRCLRALLAQDQPSYEILVIDNGSQDGTAEACREIAAEAAVPVRVEVVSGTVGAARNRAGEIARGEFLAFTDSDCLADSGWLSAIVTAFRADPGLGVVCGRTRPEEPVVRRWPQTQDISRFSGWFEACNVAFRTEAFRSGEGFDASIGMHCEDTVAGYATISHGWRAAFLPNALILHDVTYPGFRWHLKRALWMKNLGPVVRRYPQIRRELFWAHVFVKRRDAELLAALLGAGATAARRNPSLLLLALPYLLDRWRPWNDPKAAWQTPIYDSAFLLGCIRGGISARRIVL